MNNTVIEVLDMEHGKKVIDFFKSRGVDTRDLEGTLCKADSDPERFCGVIRGVFAAWSTSDLRGVEIITLPEYPKVMEVSDFVDFRGALKRVVFMEKNGRYLAWTEAETLEEADSTVVVSSWSYARDIEPGPDTWCAVAIDPPWGIPDNAVAVFRDKDQAREFGRSVSKQCWSTTEVKAPSIESIEGDEK